MDCQQADNLVQGYLDGELSEAQAGPLRQHLMDCAACRARAQQEKALRAWFVPEPAPAVPPGFAARVARRALAGDPGRDWTSAPAAEEVKSLQRFLLQATAIAATLLIVLSLGLGRGARPGSTGAPIGLGGAGARGELAADELTRREALLRLEALNRAEDREAEAPASQSESADDPR